MQPWLRAWVRKNQPELALPWECFKDMISSQDRMASCRGNKSTRARRYGIIFLPFDLDEADGKVRSVLMRRREQFWNLRRRDDPSQTPVS